MPSRSAADVESGWDQFRRARLRFHRYRTDTDVARKTGLALALAALTGLAAQVRIPLPFTPVPITLQTFAVLLTGVLLGARWGGASQGLYAGLGVAGVPWFAGWSAGLGRLFGPTGGYVLGFVLAATLVGFLTDRYTRAREPAGLLAVLFVANFAVVYGVGLPWLYGWLALVRETSLTLVGVLELGLLPFVLGDLAKLLAAAGVGWVLSPGDEFDAPRTGASARGDATRTSTEPDETER
ncbi:biotin transporter BioY [Halobacteriales archaeon SW_7_71_33]|nr:MAG: biotin transporter BioY [Halobacteriales archaeon SW_7_71_33]